MGELYKKLKKIVRWILATRLRRIMASFLIIIFIITPLSFLLFNKKTEAAWFDDNWYYRKSIPLTNNTTAENNVYVTVSIDTSDTAKFQADCGDLRFTKYNGELLPYYIASGCGTGSTSVYVAFDVFPAGAQTIYYYYGNPSADNGFSTAQTGSVTRANIRLSIVNGTAFADFSAAGPLTENLGKKLVITDSASKKLTGYIKAAGTGETYGSELLANTDFENVTGLTPGGTSILTSVAGGQSGNALQVDNGSGASNGRGWEAPTTTSGTLYRFSAYCKKGTNNEARLYIIEDGGSYSNFYSADELSGVWTPEYINYTRGSYPLYAVGYDTDWTASPNLTGFFDTSSFKQILTPSTTGATITSTANGGTYNWASEEGSFNRNDSSNYTYIIYPQAFSTEASNYAVGSLGSEEKSTAPVGYWSFDEGYGGTAHDETSNRNDGTLGASTAAPTWKPESECLSGKCLGFDGSNDYVSMPDRDGVNDFDYNQDFTVSTWFKAPSAQIDTAQTSNEIIAKWSQSGGYPYIIRFLNQTHSTNANKIQVARYDGSNNPGIFSSSTYNDNEWHHIEFLKNGSNLYLYIDGKQNGNSVTDTTSTATTNNSALFVGERGNSANRFTGSIDEPKIYPYARTAAQIKQDYNAGLAGIGKAKEGSSVSIGGGSDKWLTDGLVGHWKMDEAAGSWDDDDGFEDAIDSSGNGNTGDAVGDADAAAGKFGNGGTFDGTGDYVGVPYNSNLKLGNTGTISVWYKPAVLNSGTHHIISYGAGDTYDTGYLFNQSGSNLIIYWKNGAGAITVNSAFVVGNWYYLTLVNNNGALTLYNNGQQIGIGTSGGAITANLSTFIGGESAYGRDINGITDEARVYNRALSPGEVQKLYEWAPGPVGEWKMDEKVSGDAKTLNDSSGNGNNGTTDDGANNTGMDCTKPGKYGTGCQFDGVDDYIDTATGFNSTTSYQMTVSAWVYIDQHNEGRIISRDWVGNGSFVLVEYGSGSEFFTFSLKNTDGTRVNINSNNGSAPLKTWTHVAGVFDGATASVYVNGIKQSNTASITGSIYGAGIPRIGGGSGVAFNGNIDDIRIYNYARTQKQILEDMGGGQKGTLEPIAYYKFDEGFSDVAHNEIAGGSALNGTVTEAAWSNSGKFGKTLDFDGSNDVITVTNSSPVDLNDNLANGFSVSAWVNADSDGESDTGQIFWKGANTYLRVSGQSGSNLNIDASVDLATTDATKSLTAPITTGSWNHIVMAYDYANGDKITLYVNGKNMGSSANGVGVTAAESNNLLIGGTTTANFDGKIDEFKVYNYPLTDNDIKADYNRGASTVLGSTGTNSSGAPDSSASREYCVPGDTTSCTAPVAEWNFNEKVSGDSKTLYDTSGNGNNGTTNWGANASGMDCTKTGKHGSACSFDGADDYVNFGTDSELAGGSALTVSAWIKPNVDDGYILARGQNTDHDTMSWYLFLENGTINFATMTSAGQNWDARATSIGTVDSSGNEWTHVTATYDDADDYLRIYINGIADGTATDGGSIATGINMSTYVGVRMGNTALSDYFTGAIDQVRIYNYARTPSQIAWDYNKGKPIAEWRFDECQGETVHDESGNGNNGTINLGASGQTANGTCTDNANTPWYNGRTGKKNSSFNFDGTDDTVRSVDSSSLSITSDLTMSAWVYPVNVAGWRTIVGKQALATHVPPYSNYALFRSSDTSKWAVRINAVLAHFGTVNYNGWSHLVCAYTASINTVVCYINGASVAVFTTFNDTPDDSAYDLRIGSTAAGEYFSGLIDDVKIYNYALTPLQVKNLYNNNSAVYFGN